MLRKMHKAHLSQHIQTILRSYAASRVDGERGSSLMEQSAQQRGSGEQHHKDNRNIKYQLLNSTTRFEARAAAWRAESATQSCAADLEQNEYNHGYAQDNLNNMDRVLPLCQNSSSLS